MNNHGRPNSPIHPITGMLISSAILMAAIFTIGLFVGMAI